VNHLLVLKLFLSLIVARILLGVPVLHLVVKSHKRVKYRVCTWLFMFSWICLSRLSSVYASHLLRRWVMCSWLLTDQRSDFLSEHLHVFSSQLFLCSILICIVVFYILPMLGGADRKTCLCNFCLFVFFILKTEIRISRLYKKRILLSALAALRLVYMRLVKTLRFVLGTLLGHYWWDWLFLHIKIGKIFGVPGVLSWLSVFGWLQLLLTTGICFARGLVSNF
jgi:hypothetical protein